MSFDLKLSERDLSFKNGDLEIVTDSNKLIQDVLKICMTPLGANPFNPWYGSLINKTLIGSVLDQNIIITSAQSQLQLALNTLQSIQVRQLNAFQKLTAAEQLAAVLNISIERSPFDPTFFDVRLTVLSKAYKQLSTTLSISPF